MQDHIEAVKIGTSLGLFELGWELPKLGTEFVHTGLRPFKNVRLSFGWGQKHSDGRVELELVKATMVISVSGDEILGRIFRDNIWDLMVDIDRSRESFQQLLDDYRVR